MPFYNNLSKSVIKFSSLQRFERNQRSVPQFMTDPFVLETLYVSLEFASNGDLRTFLRKSRSTGPTTYSNLASVTSLTQTKLLGFGLDAARGLKHLGFKQVKQSSKNKTTQALISLCRLLQNGDNDLKNGALPFKTEDVKFLA